MWHEARKREKATQKLLNEHKKRVEKRRGENVLEPNSLLQVQGLRSKLHIDPNVYKQAEKSLVAWQGDQSITIDRFDVRATLTSIPSGITASKSSGGSQTARGSIVLDAGEPEQMRKLLKYERYRLLVQSDLSQVPEQLRLKLIASNDNCSSDAKLRKLQNNRFGTSGETYLGAQTADRYSLQSSRETSKRGAAISFDYKSVPPPQPAGSADSLGRPGQTDNCDQAAQHPSLKMIDLEEFEKVGLDFVTISGVDSIRLSELTKKYGMVGAEFTLLSKHDDSSIETSRLVGELKRLADKLQSRADDLDEKQTVYGPTLPPELTESSPQHKSSPDHSPSSSDSPVRQRSPSGATIPLRVEMDNTQPASSSSKDKSNGQPDSATDDPDSKGVSVAKQSSPAPVESANDPSRQSRRRAVTPLAYRRFERSSRSLSRERRSRRRSRRLSSSSASSSASSPSSNSESSGSSSSGSSGSASSSSSTSRSSSSSFNLDRNRHKRRRRSSRSSSR